MPNGGSDCCGTCWFNLRNKGEAGYDHAKDPEPNRCVIRNIDISDPYYTYCANHPHRNPARLTVPIGAVYTGDSQGEREVWLALEGSRENREAHLELLRALTETTPDEYPLGKSTLTSVIEQLAAWGETRAVPLLERVANRTVEEGLSDFVAYPRQLNIEAARAALESLRKREGGTGS
jgi:hypothetical protein